MNIRIKKNQDRKKVWHHISDLCRYLRSLKYNYSETIKQIKAGGARVKPFGCQMRESSVYSNSGHFLLAVYVYHGIKLVRMKAGNIVQNNSELKTKLFSLSFNHQLGERFCFIEKCNYLVANERTNKGGDNAKHCLYWEA